MASRRRLEYALDRWCVGEHLAHGRMAADLQQEYEAVVTAAVAYLGRCRSVDDLVEAYFGDDPADQWPEEWCRRSGGPVLEPDVVQDAAYWRRYQELQTATAQAPSPALERPSGPPTADAAGQGGPYDRNVGSALPGEGDIDQSLTPSTASGGDPAVRRHSS